MEIGNTPSGSDGVRPHTPEAFKGIAVVPTMGGEKLEASRAGVVVEWRVELVCPIDPAAIHDHHDVFAGMAEGGPDLRELLASRLGIKVGHDCIEDLGGAIVDRADDAAQDAAGDATP